MKIAIFEIEPWEKEVFQKAFPKNQLIFSASPLKLNLAKKYQDIDILGVFVHSNITEEILNSLPKLKLIVTLSTGFDHINLNACKKRNIPVCNVPTYGENTVAEQTFALILALSRKIIASVERTKKGSFDLEGLRGFDLKNKTIGIIGCGNIGKNVVKIAAGFGMKLLVFDVFKDNNFAKQYGFQYVTIDELLKNSDIITIHVPYNEHTHHLINTAAFAKMKKNAFLINTSRGGIVDTQALVKALKSGKLAGAGLDVLEGECDIIEEKELISKDFSKQCDLLTLVENHILLTMPNVLITPHNAFNTQEALMRILQTTVDNINGFRQKKLINVVNK